MSKAISPTIGKNKEARPVSSENKRNTTGNPSSAPIKITITGRACLFIYGLALLPFLVAGGLWLKRSTEASRKISATKQEPENKSAFYLNPGPWGTIEYVPFSLEIPEEYLSVRLDEKSDGRWFFRGYAKDNLSKFFTSLTLTETERGELLKAAQEVPNGLSVSCPASVRFSLTPEARRQIYSVLAQYPENIWQREEAYAIPADKLDGFFAGVAVSEQTVALVKKLCWRRGKLMLFSDMPAVLETLSSPKEKLALEQALSRRPTMLLKLHLSAQNDMDNLINYWGRGGMKKDLRPLFDGMSKLPEGATVDVMHLLPPVPSSRVYTYPYPSFNQPENCHWTSFNFFRDPPEGDYTDLKLIRQKLDNDYYPVFTDPRYGDLVFLMKPSGEIIHSCVFIADNVVYSKNGGHFSAPWLLMTLPNLLDTYATFVGENEQIKTFYYRNKYL